MEMAQTTWHQQGFRFVCVCSGSCRVYIHTCIYAPAYLNDVEFCFVQAEQQPPHGGQPQTEQPPYKAGDKVEDGIKCYKCNSFTGTSWYSIMEHLRHKHCITYKMVAGTFLHEQAKQEKAAKDKARYTPQAGGTAKAAKRAASTAAAAKPGLEASVAPVPESLPAVSNYDLGTSAAAAASATTAPITNQELVRMLAIDDRVLRRSDGTVIRTEDGGFWKAFFVRLTAEGYLHQPLNVMEINPSDSSIPESFAPIPTGGQKQASAAAPPPAAPTAKPTAKPIAKPASAPEFAAAASAAGAAPHAQQWAAELPKLTIKQLYIETPVPQVKRGVRTGGWPVKVGKFAFEHEGFQDYLSADKNLGEVAREDTIRGMTRLLHMLDFNGAPATQEKAADPAWLVALYLGNLHTKLFQLPIMAAQFSWTRKALDALRVFVAYQQTVVGKQQLISDSPRWVKFAASLEQLAAALRVGVAKRVAVTKKTKTMQKRVDDAYALHGLPPTPVLQAAVKRAMVTLQYISQQYRSDPQLPAGMQAQATAAMVGILFLNGFGGRKHEWEVLTLTHVEERFAKGSDFILCEEHKTSHVYGDLAKWLAPGTIAAMKVYMGLPRRPGFQRFLVPEGLGTERADVPNYFKRFCIAHLPADSTRPTVNLVRKWFHTGLARMSRTEDGLLKLMQAIDAHSAFVARRHYVLKTPEDDAAIAKSLVIAMLGDTVPWPAAAELEGPSYQLVAAAADAAAAATAAGGDPGGEDDDDDDAESDLEWFEGAQMFGIPKPSPAIHDGQVTDEVVQRRVSQTKPRTIHTHDRERIRHTVYVSIGHPPVARFMMSPMAQHVAYMCFAKQKQNTVSQKNQPRHIRIQKHRVRMDRQAFFAWVDKFMFGPPSQIHRLVVPPPHDSDFQNIIEARMGTSI